MTIDHEMNEITIRFEFQPSDREAAKQCAIVHTHILLEMQTAFEDDIKIYNNKSAILPKINPILWNGPSLHQRSFVIHAKPGTITRRTKYIIIHRVHTNQTMSTLCNYGTIAKLLRDNNCYMKAHSWEETTWDTSEKPILI
jgi:hypothetical protein